MPETKLNSKGETLYRTPGGNAWTTRDPNRVTTIYTPIEGENAGQRVSLKADGTKTVAPPSGITTSDNASNRNKAANETLASITPPPTTGSSGNSKATAIGTLMIQLNDLQTKLAKAKKAEAEAEATADVKSKLKSISSSEEVSDQASADMSAGVDAISGRGSTGNIEDPTIRALSEKTSANLAIITNQMQTLDQYRQQFNEYTQQDIDSIARTAARSIQRQTEENERITNAIRFAGVLGGRAQFAPVTEQSIIKDVIQEGLDKVEVINEKKNTAIREARKAEAEFNVDVFEQQAELAKEYNNEIESTISAMNSRVREIEQDERERAKFRQEQADRSAFILAPELMDATPDQIAQAAAVNGIDPGLLAREVQTYKDEQRMTALDIEGKEADLIGQRISNAINQEELNELRNPKGKKEDPLTPDELLKWNKLFGYTDKDDSQGIIPPTWTRDDINNFATTYGNAPKEDVPRLIEQYNSIVQIQNGEDAELKGVMPTEEVVDKVVKQMETAMFEGQGIFGKGSAAGVMAGKDDTAKGINWGGRDAKIWFNSKGKTDITARAKEMAEQGLEWYEIVDELANEYGTLTEKEIKAR